MIGLSNSFGNIIAKLQSLFVLKEEGKGLSSNDYTTEEKNKLSSVAQNANNYTLPVASASTLGGVKVGSGFSISDDGVLSASNGNGLKVIATGTLSYSYSGDPRVTFSNPAVFVLCETISVTESIGYRVLVPGDRIHIM